MNSHKLPYSDIFYNLLAAIHIALWYCQENYKSDEILREDDVKLSQIFESALDTDSKTGLDQHIIKGLTVKEKNRTEPPRLVRLVVRAFNRVKENETSKVILPSPLSILYQALTVPNQPQTASYAFVLCRGMLFHFLKVHTKHPELQNISPSFDGFVEEDIQKAISSFKNNAKISSRWPGNRSIPSSLSSRINYLTGHILSIKGYSYLWFKSEKALKEFCNASDQHSAIRNCYQNKLSSQYSFRMSSLYADLPDSSEINNWIFGIPIPWRGADLLFFGGLKKTSSTGLVCSVHGKPGAGKTSMALSLASILEPMGTKTMYLSLEENPPDLKTRLQSLVPDYLRKLSIFSNNEFKIRFSKGGDEPLDWFKPLKFSDNLSIEEIIEILKELSGELSQKANYSKEKSNSIPATCPLLLVIDNVNELLNGKVSYDEVERFVEQCRNMGALVVLIAADEIPQSFKLDYLVDVAIHLDQEGIDNRYQKPVRIFQLLKTRHQISRQGTHVFHLSSSSGFRISPQVPSQLDKREKVKVKLPSKSDFIHTLNIQHPKDEPVYREFLPVAVNSHILVHGHGSSGKAGFGLKLLLTPIFESKRILNPSPGKGKLTLEGKNEFQMRKVLILSFLYPEEYYQTLKDRVDRQFLNSLDGYSSRKTIVKVKAFYPGFLTPEDFVNKVIRLLEEARLEGEPFTGVLLDGLHNISVQFKNLQESDMIWPLLYSLLKRYSVTVVTTFTNISLSDGVTSNLSSSAQTPNDFVIFESAQKPFLHGIVKGSDYFFMLEERRIEKGKGSEDNREYWLSVRSSIRQTPPNSILMWNREELTIYKEIRSEDQPDLFSQLLDKKNSHANLRESLIEIFRESNIR